MIIAYMRWLWLEKATVRQKQSLTFDLIYLGRKTTLAIQI